jgi:hypothetical protein
VSPPFSFHVFRISTSLKSLRTRKIFSARFLVVKKTIGRLGNLHRGSSRNQNEMKAEKLGQKNVPAGRAANA